MSSPDPDTATGFAQALDRVFPPGSERYVTHEQMAMALSQLESRLEIKLENAMLKTRNWVLGGILASAVLFGGGFITMMNKIDRMSQSLPQLAQVQEGRRDFFQQQPMRDATQDSAIKKLDPNYDPLPYEAPPQ